MAVQRRMKVSHGMVFPHGAFLVGPVEAVADFDAPKRADDTRPQQRDKVSGQLMWSVSVLDADPEARKAEKTVTVKIAAPHQPVPPEDKSGLPFKPVTFDGLTVTAYLDENGRRPKVAWSFWAEGMSAPKGPVRAAPAGEDS